MRSAVSNQSPVAETLAGKAVSETFAGHLTILLQGRILPPPYEHSLNGTTVQALRRAGAVIRLDVPAQLFHISRARTATGDPAR
jgi:hypothetical protein